MMRQFSLVKRNKKLMVVGDSGEIVYCPPNFLSNRFQRHHLQCMTDLLNMGEDRLELVMAFEKTHNRRQ